MRAARRAGLVAGLLALAGALVAELHGHLQLRLLLWVLAAGLGGPAVLHALLVAVPRRTVQDARQRPAELGADRRAPLRVNATVGTAQLRAPARPVTGRPVPALPARRPGEPPAARRRAELTR